jgi:hypothetical protein
MRSSIGVAALALLFAAAIVGCSDASRTVPPPAASDSVAAAAVDFANTKCPIMGGQPSADLTVDYGGKTIGFCCDGCPQKWATFSDQQKAEAFAKVDALGDQADSGHDHAEGNADHDHATP